MKKKQIETIEHKNDDRKRMIVAMTAIGISVIVIVLVILLVV